MAKMNMVDAINLALKQEMERDETVMVMGDVVGLEGGVFRVTVGLQELYGEERVVDTPLAESGIVGTAFGLALGGMKPVAEIQFMGFVYPAFDQIISHLGRIRNRSRGRFHVQMVVRMPYGGGIHAPEHHSESTEAIFAHTPGIKVVIPSTPYDAKGLLVSSIRDPDPVIFLEPKRVYRAIKQEVPEEEYAIPLGTAGIVQEGSQLTLISWGSMVREAREAAAMAGEKGISVEIIDLRTVSPIDDEAIMESVKKTGWVVVLHEAPRTCGMGAEIIARINDKAFLYLQAPVERVTGFDTFFPYLKGEHFYLPDTRRIMDAIDKVMNY